MTPNLQHQDDDAIHKQEPGDLTTDDLRRAAARLATRDGARRIRMLPIPKRLMAALHEDAFPAQPRGLAYDEELEDLVRFLSACSPDDTTTEAIANAAVALHDSHVGFDGGDPQDQALLDFLRATATYFLRIHAVRFAEMSAATDRQEP
jgi:hypothetical protein